MLRITRFFQKSAYSCNRDINYRCFIFAVLIAALVYGFVFTGGDFRALIIVQGLFIFWVILNFVFKTEKFRFSTYGIIAWWVLSLILFGNIWYNIDNYNLSTVSFLFAFAHVAGVIAFAMAAQWAARNLNPTLIFELLAWMLAPLSLLVIVLWFIVGIKGRAEFLGLHPNWWGEMAFGFVLCALSIRLIKVRIAFIGYGLLIMYIVQSRGAMLAALVSILTFWILGLRPFGKTAMKRSLYALVGSVIVLFFVFIMDWLPNIIAFVEERVLLLYNPYRGLGTGFTGRLSQWQEGMSVFIENPILGNGFDTLQYIHNGFLRFAAEGGVILFGVMTFMIVSALVYAWRQRIDLAFAALLGISTYFMTYPRALNLNIVGVLFLLTLFRWKPYNQGKEFFERAGSSKGRFINGQKNKASY